MLPQLGLGQSPADKRFGAFWESKSAALVAAVFVDFSKNKCKIQKAQ